jgi:sulfopyruvate decarboxylase subunit beta
VCDVQRIACIDVFARLRGAAVVIVGPGYAGHELATARHGDLTLYNMDMGYAAPICLGLALARPDQRVVAIEGDGSMLMALHTLATAARYRPPNLTIIVFDNGYYLTTGRGSVATATGHGMDPAAGHRTDLAAVARAAGLDPDHVCAAGDLPAFEAAAARALTQPGPWYIVARVDTADRGHARARGEFPTDVVEQAVLFQLGLRRHT